MTNALGLYTKHIHMLVTGGRMWPLKLVINQHLDAVLL